MGLQQGRVARLGERDERLGIDRVGRDLRGVRPVGVLTQQLGQLVTLFAALRRFCRVTARGGVDRFEGALFAERSEELNAVEGRAGLR